MKNKNLAIYSWGLFLVPVLATIPLGASAQSTYNDFELEYTYSSPSEGDFEDEIEIHEGKAGLMFTLSERKNDGVGFVIGGQFQADVWSPDNDDLDDLDLYKVKIPVMVDFGLGENFGLSLGVTPGIHSDFEEVDSDDWRVDGSALLSYSTDKSLVWMAGAAIGEEFGEAKAFPIGGVRWTPNETWTLDIFFPRPRIQYAVSDSFHLFLFGEPSGGEWNVGDKDVQVDVQQKGYRVGAGLEFAVAEKSWLYATGGTESGRELQIALNDDEVFDDEVDLDDQAFFRVGFRVAH